MEQILAVTVGMVDTVMVSSAGEAAASGVSLVDMINNLIIGFLAEYDGERKIRIFCRNCIPLLLWKTTIDFCFQFAII